MRLVIKSTCLESLLAFDNILMFAFDLGIQNRLDSLGELDDFLIFWFVLSEFYLSG